MPAWDASTMAIGVADVTLYQSLDAAQRRGSSLVVYSGSETGRQIRLPEGLSTLGRSAAASLQIDGQGMSRLHAELQVTGGRVTLRDLGSANGSFVQDRRVDGPCVLADGDLLRLGSVLLKFYPAGSLDAALHDRVYRLAMVDAGTGLYNRRYLLDALRRELRQARQGDRPLSVIGADLDHFKRVNDLHGHEAGDRVLRECAVVLGRELGPSDILGRLGGEEFLVLMPGATASAAQALAERLRAAVAGHVFELPVADSAELVRHRQTLSLGVAEWCPTLLDDRDLLAAADRRLYQAKRDGRNRVAA